MPLRQGPSLAPAQEWGLKLPTSSNVLDNALITIQKQTAALLTSVQRGQADALDQFSESGVFVKRLQTLIHSYRNGVCLVPRH